jgi:TPR repeat protein
MMKHEMQERARRGLFERSRLLLSLLALSLLAGCNYHQGQTAYDAGSPEEAAQKWQAASRFGDTRSQMALAKLYLRGEGVPRDATAAAQLIKPLAENYNSWQQMWAQEVLADAYSQQGQMEDAVYWYRSAAELGNPSARNKLALAYLEGKGVERDTERAVDLYQESADGGDYHAMTALAGLYADGVGIGQNIDRAAGCIRWRKRPAIPGRNTVWRKCI